MTFEQFKKATYKQLIEYGKSIPLGFTKDKDGNKTSFGNSYGDYEINGKRVSKEKYEEFIKEMNNGAN